MSERQAARERLAACGKGRNQRVTTSVGPSEVIVWEAVQ